MHLLAGVARHSRQARLRASALSRLAALTEACSGDEFAHLTEPGGVLWTVACGASASTSSSSEPAGEAAGPGAGAPPPGEEHPLLLRCAERARRGQGLPAGEPPRGGVWDRLGRPRLQALLRRQGSAPAGAGAGEGGDGLVRLRRGFLGAAGAQPKPAAKVVAGGEPLGEEIQAGPTPTSAAAPAAPAAASPPGPATHHGRGIVIEDITEDSGPAAEPPCGAAAWAAPPPLQQQQAQPC